MLAFLDTEFTDLVISPRLLSVGLVTERRSGREFYAEVSNPDRIQATNWFGLDAVLPQFGKIANASCSYAELGSRLLAFLENLVQDLQADEFIELAYGYYLDWELVDLAISDTELKSWKLVRRRVHPINIYEITSTAQGKIASEAYFEAQALAPFSRHHALCDACALRLAYEAATQAMADKPEQGRWLGQDSTSANRPGNH